MEGQARQTHEGVVSEKVAYTLHLQLFARSPCVTNNRSLSPQNMQMRPIKAAGVQSHIAA
jgi:hypothetical protein